MGAATKGRPGALRAGTVVMSLTGAVMSLAAATPAQAAAAWRIAAEPPLIGASRLLDVSATGPADAWAVGYQDVRYGEVPDRPAALLHWDGTAWTERRSLPEEFDGPVAVSARTATDVWTVGTDDDLEGYAAHWTGTAWQGQSVRNGGRLSDVAARYGRPLVVGARTGGGALVMEWTGQEFAEITVPGVDAWSGGQLRGVASAPNGDAFAVGEWSVDDAGYPEPLIVQRTGGVWRVAALPKVPEARLVGVYARSAADAWAVGTIRFDSSRPEPLILHWDGRSWQRVTAPTASAGLASVSGDPQGNLWISGTNPTEPYGPTPGSLFLRLQKSKWSVVYGPKVNADQPFHAADPHLSAVENIPGTTAYWGVGAAADIDHDHEAVIERIG